MSKIYADFRQFVTDGMIACRLDRPQFPWGHDDTEVLRRQFLFLVETVSVGIKMCGWKANGAEVKKFGGNDPVYTISTGRVEATMAWRARIDPEAATFRLVCNGTDTVVLRLAYSTFDDDDNVVRVLEKANRAVGEEVAENLAEVLSR